MTASDDMALARATAEAHGYHQRSPSMMIVVPLKDDTEEDALYCDELNASYYDFFQKDDGCAPSSSEEAAEVRRLESESPRSVLEEPITIFAPKTKGLAPKRQPSDPRIIPIITDLIQNIPISEARKSCHRRSRNRAFTATEFARNVLPHLEEAQSEHHHDNDDRSSPLLKVDESILKIEEPTEEFKHTELLIEAEC